MEKKPIYSITDKVIEPRPEEYILKKKIGLFIRKFLIDNRRIWNDAEWDLIRMKWFKLEEKGLKSEDDEIPRLGRPKP